jgi:serine/threonine protein kinase
MGNICHCLDNKNADDHRYTQLGRSLADETARKIITYKDYKGFKKIGNINEKYEFGDLLGQGSFGVVKRAMHKQAHVECAVKFIAKKKVHEHQILTNLMHNELEVLEETVRVFRF